MTKPNKKPGVAPAPGRKRKIAAWSCLALLISGAVYYKQSGSNLLEQVLPESLQSADGYSYDWPNGTIYTYGLNWTASQDNRLVQPQKDGTDQIAKVTGKLALSSDLTVRSYGKAADGYILGVSLTNISKLSWQVLGEDVIAPAAQASAFAGREALMEIDSAGHVRRTFFAASTPPEFRGLMQWLLPQLQFSLADKHASQLSDSWTAAEETLQGRVQTHYHVEASEPIVLRRERPVYESLRVADVTRVTQVSKDVALATCADAGHLETVDSHLTFTVSDASGALVTLEEKLDLKLTDVTKGPALGTPDLHGDSFVGYALAESPSSDSSAQQALVNRVGKLNVGDMVSHVLEFANAGRMDNRWLWQATGLLQLHPESAEELARIFDNDDLSTSGRSMILDLLASAGTPEAQKALRDLLDSEVAREDPTTHAVYYNRVALVDANEETAQYAVQQFEAHAEEDVGPMRVATTYALGAVAGRQNEQGNKAAALELNQHLVQGLEQASDADSKVVVVRAMGNAGLEDNVETLVKYTKESSTELRAAAADALRKTKTGKSTDALLELLKDPEWEVQQAALSSLSAYPLSVAEVKRIEELVLAGVVGSRNDPMLVTVLSQNATSQQPYAAGFLHLLQRNQGNGQLAARIRAIVRRNGVTI